MPSSIKYVDGRVDAEYRVTMSWDFEAKLLSKVRQPESIKVGQDDFESVPLCGDWRFSLDSNADDLTIRVKHGELPVGALGERVTVTGEFAYLLDDGTWQQIDTHAWAANTAQPELSTNGSPYSAYKYSRSKHKLAQKEKLPNAIQKSIQQYRFSITVTQEPRKAPEPKPDLTKALANLSSAPSDSFLSSANADQGCTPDFAHSPTREVRLLFKRPADNLELELWTDVEFLNKASDYYKALSASGGIETVVKSRKKRQRAAAPTVVLEQKQLPAPAPAADLSVDWQDSDDETDAFLVERDWMNCTTTKQDTAEFDYQEIEVHETAYSTMCAVLLYLQTGLIKFAPLRSSSHALSPDELTKKRNASLAKSLEAQPTLPPAVSPKSVYRLAHLLERNDLEQKALDSLASNLTISGAAAELFSPVSVAYDQVRKIVFDFVVENWDEVKVTEAWRAVRSNVTRGHGQAAAEGAAQILFDLLAAINDS